MRRFEIQANTRVAMVGLFDPLVKMFAAQQVEVKIIDEFRGLGQKDVFYARLIDWADVLILTSTTILNNSAEEILKYAGRGLKTVLLGPSTPMVPEAFVHLPVHMLAGAVALDQTRILKAVRHGTGARMLNLYGKKVCWVKGDTILKA